MPRISLSELARRLGHNKGYVHKLKSRGVLEFDGDGLIDEAEARAAIEESRDPSKAYMGAVNEQQRANGRGELDDLDDDGDEAKNAPEGSSNAPEGSNNAPSANANFMRARTMREVLAAKRAQVEFKRFCGDLIDVQIAIKKVTDAAVIIRTSLEGLPDRLAKRVAAESDENKCHAILIKEIDVALDELATLCDRMAAEHEVNQ